MSTPQHHQPNQQPSGLPPSNKPSWLLYVIGAILLLFLLQKVGCGPVQTHEKVDWIDR
ncbi:MAG: hypothetical protein IPM82_13150 [Saprospiraceae bacterium]|nr:hypothetical protein [Saprospiraceae bacterium]